jgi:hypothetical protein
MAQRKIEAITTMAQLSQIPGINLEAMKQYIVDASGDPAFSGMLNVQTNNNQGAAPAGKGQLPTIPATKTEGK